MGQGVADKNAPLVRSLVFSPSSVLILISRWTFPNSENQYEITDQRTKGGRTIGDVLGIVLIGIVLVLSLDSEVTTFGFWESV